MKTLFVSLFVLLLAASCTDKKESLFNGENLDGWTIFVDDPSINPNEYFYVNDGMIETVGVPVGYLRTVKEYSNYKLHIEWRYPEEPTNSGIFIHTTGPDLIWVSHYQGQLKHENAGDIIIHGISNSATIRDTVYTSSADEKPLISKMHPTNEKPAGEWNSYDITCKGRTIELRVNGKLQNVATNCSVTKGGIGLQAEGSKIQFRNLWIEPIN
ncbi:MAG: DUF1080 domain-containing protein [Prolixibacteraceae bacterium]|jgi:hypothetical protein|nr:DUF1080 domain-containing protein [Prolixibacteraceae bacterium]MBT6005313.1 DUF1080 domain-containing protein [Prolixibacteraceae bacterium]MBT6763281.1 DUF1080 domain-containing protein [Prolixibacteraceae bacterium]MBT7000638.1 DUF1080 domain-containing protein [Prolixibacteraceae bacterium]MBT7396193.1 DUF1080 domain-containing protein [Prolixibacteraceae bacterium]